MKQSNLIRRNSSVRPSKIQGYGVFAEEEIKKDEIIEECYTLVFYTDRPYLINYIFDAGNDLCALPLGSGSIFNHSHIANAAYKFDTERQIMIFYALKDIKVGEEITIYYGEGWFSVRELKVKESFRYKYRHVISALKLMLRFGLIAAALYLALYLVKRW